MVTLKQKGRWRPKNSVKKKAKQEVERAIPDDPAFVKCFIKTSPSLAPVLADKNASIESEDLVHEALTLHDALGHSRVAKGRNGGAKYAEGFSFVPALLPKLDDIKTDIYRSASVTPCEPREGVLPTYHQMQMLDLLPILGLYAKHPTRFHGPDHICRSLILGIAMAKYYRKKGQPEFRPAPPAGAANDVRSRLGVLPTPTGDQLKEIDIAAICFGIAFHDSGRDGDGTDYCEHESARNAFYYLRELGYSIDYAGYIAKMIVKNEEGGGRPPKITVSKSVTKDKKGKGRRNSLRLDPPPDPADRPTNINELIIHDADVLEIHRTIAGSGKKFRTNKLKFLARRDLEHAACRPPRNRDATRALLIQDAKNLAEMTVLSTTIPKGKKAKREAAVLRFGRYANGARNMDKPTEQELADPKHADRYKRGEFGDFGGLSNLLAEFERYLIDELCEDLNSYPFLYEYYFEKCFDPNDRQFQLLTSEQRIALVRGHLHALERRSRDQQWAAKTIQDYNAKEKTQLELAGLLQHIKDSVLTINRGYSGLKRLKGKTKADPPPPFRQFWDLNWWHGYGRGGGGGASTNEAKRDSAERAIINSMTPYTAAEFARDKLYEQRPIYSAVNVARIPTGACHKYGDGEVTLYLKPHVLRRVTYTARDTFGDLLTPDSLGSPEAPESVLRFLGDRGLDRMVFTCWGARVGWNEAKALLQENLDVKMRSLNYIEAHVHGPVTWQDDVVALVIKVMKPGDGAAAGDVYSGPPKEYVANAREFCAEFGIKLGFTRPGLNHVFKTPEAAIAADANTHGEIHLFGPPKPAPPKPAPPQMVPANAASDEQVAQAPPKPAPPKPAPPKPSEPPQSGRERSDAVVSKDDGQAEPAPSCAHFAQHLYKSATECRNCFGLPGSDRCKAYVASQ